MMYTQEDGPMKGGNENEAANGQRLDDVLAESRRVRMQMRELSEHARNLDEQAHKLLKALHIQVEQREVSE
jgi:hypothetical protein